MFTITITCGDNGYIFDIKTSRNGLKVVKAGHKSEGRMGMMADRIDGQ